MPIPPNPSRQDEIAQQKKSLSEQRDALLAQRKTLLNAPAPKPAYIISLSRGVVIGAKYPETRTYVCGSVTVESLKMQHAMMEECSKRKPGCDAFTAMWDWWKSANRESREINGILEGMSAEVFDKFVPVQFAIGGRMVNTFAPKAAMEQAIAAEEAASA